jgi:hypothetical protein
MQTARQMCNLSHKRGGEIGFEGIGMSWEEQTERGIDVGTGGRVGVGH